MHVPDGLVSTPICAVAAGLSTAAVWGSLRAIDRSGRDDLIPRTTVVASLIFAGQMLNFPLLVAPASGHLLGGAMAALLLGPAAATIALTLVLVVQALIFADGGLFALGVNILNMAVIAPWSAWLVLLTTKQCGWLRYTPQGIAGLPLATTLACLVSVVAAAAAFALQMGLSTQGTPLASAWPTLVMTLLALHLAIGCGEAAITAAVVRGLEQWRPGFAALTLFPERLDEQSETIVTPVHELVQPPIASVSSMPIRPQRTPWTAGVLAGLLLVAFLTASGLSQFADSAPDGLEASTEQAGLTAEAATYQGLWPDYLVPLPSGWSEAWSTGLAGLLGTVAVAGLGTVAWCGFGRRSTIGLTTSADSPTAA